MAEGFRSWAPGWSSCGLAVLLDEEAEAMLKEPTSDNPTSQQNLVLKSCITSMAQTAALANIEADLELLDRRLAKAVLVFNELLTILDLLLSLWVGGRRLLLLWLFLCCCGLI